MILLIGFAEILALVLHLCRASYVCVHGLFYVVPVCPPINGEVRLCVCYHCNFSGQYIDHALQCNVSPIMDFVRHTASMPDEARDGRNVALK